MTSFVGGRPIVIKKEVFGIIKRMRDIYDTEVSGEIQNSDATRPGVFDRVCVMEPFKRCITGITGNFEFGNGIQAPPKTCGISAEFRAFMTFHTHPKYCYVENAVFLGIPSRSDVNMVIDNYIKYGQVVHVVCAIEGCYIYAIKKEVRDHLDKHPREAAKHYSSVVKRMYDNINRMVYAADDAKRVQTISSFIKTMQDSGIFHVYFSAEPADIQIGVYHI